MKVSRRATSSLRARMLVASCMLAGLAGCTHGTAGTRIDAASARPYVVLVSFDAFRYDYLDIYKPAAFADIAARGVRATALIPSFPTKTFPNHYTLATGLYPGHHGIVGNIFFDPARGAWYRNTDPIAVRDGSWYSGEPIWATAERNGVKSGVFYWTGSEAMIAGRRPTYWSPYDAKVPNASRVDSLILWLRKPAADRPHLVLLYISDVDDTTHKHGPEASNTGRAVASADKALRRLLDSLHALPLGDSTNVVVVSDHGMLTVTPDRLIAVDDALLRGGVDTVGMLVSENGPTMSIWLHGDWARIRATRAALERSLVHAHAYLRAETPERWYLRDNPRAGDVLIVADAGYYLERHASDKPPNPGQHGYDPIIPQMRGIFLAAGPNVRPLGVIPAFENVDIYPFLAALLRLENVPQTDGNLGVLARVLR